MGICIRAFDHISGGKVIFSQLPHGHFQEGRVFLRQLPQGVCTHFQRIAFRSFTLTNQELTKKFSSQFQSFASQTVSV